ncbi:MAG: PHP domain-containing protein, partial [Oscillospiraceae bacterium]|nr:PHP domain-containing protein [Oscillospiraceae bacterium]
MSDKIAFFDFFENFVPQRELRLSLHDALITGGVLDRQTRTMELDLELSEPLSEAADATLRQMLQSQYDLHELVLRVKLRQSNAGKDGEVLMGKAIRGKKVPMQGLNPKMGSVVLEGKVFAAEIYETKRPGIWRVNIEMTDYTGSVAVRKNTGEKEARRLEKDIAPGMWLRLQGKVQMTWDGRDIEIEPQNIQRISHQGRKDTAPEKRVELHLHTQMSSMDALTNTASVIKLAKDWGHPAIAITDHGTVQSFPDAWHNAKGIKILYGMEGYYVNNLDDRVAVHGTADQDFADEIVCFDIETTGLNVATEAITEIGAAVLKNGEITDRFQTFVDPGRHLTPEIVGLTGITDAMLQGAPKLKEALESFLAFVDGRPLAAHNAEFDVSFIRKGCQEAGLD